MENSWSGLTFKNKGTASTAKNAPEDNRRSNEDVWIESRSFLRRRLAAEELARKWDESVKNTNQSHAMVLKSKLGA